MYTYTHLILGNGNIVHLQLDKRYLAFQRLENGHCRKYGQHLGCINKLTFEHIKYIAIHFYITITMVLVQLNQNHQKLSSYLSLENIFTQSKFRDIKGNG